MNTLRIVSMAVLLTGVSRASAGTDKMALLVSGTTAPHARELATTAVQRAVQDTGRPLADVTFGSKEAAVIRGCLAAPHAWRCIAPAIRDKEVRQLAVLSLTNDTAPDRGPMIVLTGQIIVADLDAAVSAQRFCVRCTDDVLTRMTAELTHSLLQEIEVRSGRTVVNIKSTPRGARITFDGNSMGSTDRSFNTFPGKHTVVVELDGYARESRTLEAALDRTSELSIAMRPPNLRLPTMAATEHRDAERCELASPGAPTTSSLAPKLTIALGATAVVAGAVAIVFNQHPTTANPGTEQPRVYYDTMAPGVGLMIGGAVTGVGGYLWWRYTRSTVTPVIATMPNGATVALTRAF